MSARGRAPDAGANGRSGPWLVAGLTLTGLAAGALEVWIAGVALADVRLETERGKAISAEMGSQLALLDSAMLDGQRRISSELLGQEASEPAGWLDSIRHVLGGLAFGAERNDSYWPAEAQAQTLSELSALQASAAAWSRSQERVERVQAERLTLARGLLRDFSEALERESGLRRLLGQMLARKHVDAVGAERDSLARQLAEQVRSPTPVRDLLSEVDELALLLEQLATLAQIDSLSD